MGDGCRLGPRETIGLPGSHSAFSGVYSNLAKIVHRASKLQSLHIDAYDMCQSSRRRWRVRYGVISMISFRRRRPLTHGYPCTNQLEGGEFRSGLGPKGQATIA